VILILDLHSEIIRNHVNYFTFNTSKLQTFWQRAYYIQKFQIERLMTLLRLL